MGAYHAVAVHFPVALWMLTTAIILLRATTAHELVQRLDRALVPLLILSLLAGIAALVTGLLVWPWQTVSASALGRNHILTATWTIAVWTIALAIRYRCDATTWKGPARWVMVALALFGGALLGITGTLGGHLSSQSTAVSKALRLFGWEIYTTYYVPLFTLAVLAAATIFFLIIAARQPKRPTSSPPQ